MEDIPLADETVDVVISNCVINLAADGIAGALTREEFEGALVAGGLTGVEIQETHRVHEHAGSAIVRARKPERG